MWELYPLLLLSNQRESSYESKGTRAPDVAFILSCGHNPAHLSSSSPWFVQISGILTKNRFEICVFSVSLSHQARIEKFKFALTRIWTDSRVSIFFSNDRHFCCRAFPSQRTGSFFSLNLVLSLALSLSPSLLGFHIVQSKMYKVDLPLDPKEQARIDARRLREEERKARIFDTKQVGYVWAWARRKAEIEGNIDVWRGV